MTKPVSYKRHRFPPEIIAHAVWLYFRFPLSLRLIEEMLLERGIVVSYETVRRWALKFGTAYARRLRRKTPSHRDIWHLDEVVVTSRARSTGCGGLLTKTDTSLMRSSRAAATPRPPSAC
jgi:putative transposase